MSNVSYGEYLTLCDVMKQDALNPFDTDIEEHYDRLCEAHREQFGCKSAAEPINERAPTYAEYRELCIKVGASRQAETTNWGAHYKHLAHLGQLPAPLTWGEVPKPKGAATKAPTNEASPTDPAQVAVQIPIALQNAPEEATTPFLSWPQYTALAIRTESVPPIYYRNMEHADGQYTMGPAHERLTRLLHVGIGLTCEAIELEDQKDERNRLEELGDCFWYLAVATDIMGSDWDYDVDGAWRHACQDHAIYGLVASEYRRELRLLGGSILDVVGQKTVIYGKEMDKARLILLLSQYFYNLLALVVAEGGDWRAICRSNIAKLAKRYPDLTYSLEATSNRDVEHELSHIPNGGQAEVAEALASELNGDVAAASKEVEPPKA